jgi:hypothetical protein
MQVPQEEEEPGDSEDSEEEEEPSTFDKLKEVLSDN